MEAPDQEVVRRVTGWPTDGLQIISLYLDVDGRRWPRRRTYLKRAEDLTKRACEEADGLGRDVSRTVARDRDHILGFVRDLERTGPVRGVAAFSAGGGELFEGVVLSEAVRDRVRLGNRPYVVPLEALLEMAETFCTAIVDRARARVLWSRLGRVEELTELLDDVPGKHDQGGWAQARLQRHIEDHALRRHCRVETVDGAPELERLGGVGALLRF